LTEHGGAAMSRPLDRELAEVAERTGLLRRGLAALSQLFHELETADFRQIVVTLEGARRDDGHEPVPDSADA
jgi:hypothetical protein